MKAFWAMTAVSLALLGSAAPVAAQYGGPEYGGRGPGYGDRDRGYGERGPRYRDEDENFGPRRGGRNRGDYAFDEREYLRCNPDVRRAIVNGQATSGVDHYRLFGRREGRRLSC